VRLVANARHRSDGGGRRVADLEYEQDVRIAIGAIQRDAKREADQCAASLPGSCPSVKPGPHMADTSPGAAMAGFKIATSARCRVLSSICLKDYISETDRCHVELLACG